MNPKARRALSGAVVSRGTAGRNLPLGGGRVADLPAVEALLRQRGYRGARAHAEAYVSRGYDAAQLLASEARWGRFPVSSPAGPLVRRQ